MHFLWSLVFIYSLAYAGAEISLSDFVQNYNQHMGRIKWDKMLSVNQSNPTASMNIIKIRHSIDLAKDQSRLVSNQIRQLCSFARTVGEGADLSSYANIVNESKEYLLKSLDYLDVAYQTSQANGIEVRMFIFSNGTVKLEVEPGYSCKVKRLLKNFHGDFQCSTTRGTTFYSNELQSAGTEQSFEHIRELSDARHTTMSAVDRIEATKLPATEIDTRKLLTECNVFLHRY